MLCRSKPLEELLLGDSNFSLCIIVVNSVLECVVHELADFNGCTKVNYMRRLVSMGRFGLTVRYPNPKQKGVQS